MRHGHASPGSQHPKGSKCVDPEAFYVTGSAPAIDIKQVVDDTPVRAGLPHVAKLRAAWLWVNTYRRLFAAVFGANLVLMVLAAADVFHFGAHQAVGWAVGNVLLAVLFRNELFLCSMVYFPLVYGCRVLCAPLWVKHGVTDFLLHLGGIHSGAGASAILWVGLAVGQQLAQIHKSANPVTAIALAWIILILLVVTTASAIPTLRWHHHNTFELFHRYAGWTCLAALWVLVLLGLSWDPGSRRCHLHRLLHRPELWMTSAITLLIIAPWLCIWRVPVETTVPSPGNVVLKFRGGIADGLLGRVSRHALHEWHAFGTLSLGPKSDEHLMVVVARGDWTRGLIADPPKHLWVRAFRFAGLPYTARMLDSFVWVATGAGIGVALSSVIQLASRVKTYLIWVAKEPETTYGPEVLRLVHSIAPDRRLIIDTASQARPDIPALVVERAGIERADSVYIVSNPELTQQIWRACGASGVKAFGPIWDS